jgi:hypothetical protein
MALASNGSSTATTILTLPAGLSGTYYIVACANGNNLVSESTTANNCSGSAFTVTALPDFTESGISIAGTIANGGTIQVTDTTNNIGTGASGGSTTDIYLSSSPTSPGSFLGGHGVGGLASNGGSTTTTTVHLMTGIPLNHTYYIVACANANNLAKESNMTNNCSGVAFSVTD